MLDLNFHRITIQQTKMIVTCQRFGDLFLFGLVWSGSIKQFRQNIINVGSKSWLLTCSSNHNELEWDFCGG